MRSIAIFTRKLSKLTKKKHICATQSKNYPRYKIYLHVRFNLGKITHVLIAFNKSKLATLPAAAFRCLEIDGRLVE